MDSMRLSPALLLVALAACGASPSDYGGEGHGVGRITIDYADSPEQIPDSSAMTFYRDGYAQVLMSTDLDAGVSWQITVHEILHGLGLEKHETDQNCFMHPMAHPNVPYNARDWHLCPQERDRLMACIIPTVIEVLDPGLLSLTRSAVLFLNAEIGWEALHVEAAFPQ